MRITQIVILVLLLAGGTFAVPCSATFGYADENGNWTETELSDIPAEAVPAGNPVPLDCEILWDGVIPYGEILKFAVIGYNDDYVWQGGWNGAARLFEMAGDGTPLWEIVFGNDNRISVAAAQTADIFYAAANNISNDAFKVHKFNHTSSTPDWVWDGAAAGYHSAYLDLPGRVDCSDDGSVFAVGGHDGDSLAVMLFHDDSPTPFLIYEDETIGGFPQHVRLTADGSKCIFTAGDYVYRVDVATGTLESTYDTGYTTYSFGVSPDGSLIAVGYGSQAVIQWDGSQYVRQFYVSNSGYNIHACAVAGDNDTIVLTWSSTGWDDIAVSLISLANGNTPLWTWEATGSSTYDDLCAWADISDDGEWIGFCSWGNYNNSHPEVMVFNRDSSTPWFGIDTEGSPYSMDLSRDGQYLCCGSKVVHANVNGSGGNVIASRIDHTTAVDSVDLFANSRDDGVLLSWSILGDTPASVSVLRGLTQNDTLTPTWSVDISGALAGSATSWLDVSVEPGVEYAYYLEVTEFDGTVSRFGPSEVIVPVAVSELALSDPYPNPANESLTIHYELTQNATVKLHIYDVAGRLVETLVSGEQTAGRHSVSWDSSASATGVYLLRLEAEGKAITKRAVISR